MWKKSLLLLTTTAFLWPVGAAYADHARPRQDTEKSQPKSQPQPKPQPKAAPKARPAQKPTRPHHTVTPQQAAERRAKMRDQANGGERAYRPAEPPRTQAQERPGHVREDGSAPRRATEDTARQPRDTAAPTQAQERVYRPRESEDLARFGTQADQRGYERQSHVQDRPRRDTTNRRDRDDHRRVQDRDRDHDRDRDRDRRPRYDRDDHHRVWYQDRYRRVYRHAYWTGYYDNFWWNSYYRSSYIYYRPYYFGDWPYYSGYWPVYSRWVWFGPHHHYHYGGYCPGLSFEYTVRYSSDPYAYSPPDANNLVGTILGGVVGGIIGSEIDGSRHHRAGTVIGALVGAAIGNAVTQPRVDRGYDASTTYRRDETDPGAYDYGRENYVPPADDAKRSCLEYKMQNGSYVCSKWGTEYNYSDEDTSSDTPQQ